MLSPFRAFSSPAVLSGCAPWFSCHRGWSCPRNSSTVCVFSASSGPSRPTRPDCGYVSTVLILLGQTCCCLRTCVLLLFLLVSKRHWERWSSPLGPPPSRVLPAPCAHRSVHGPGKAGQGPGHTLPPLLPGGSSHTKFPLKVAFLNQLNYTFIKQKMI